MHTHLCQENRRYVPAHPDKVFLDRMGLVVQPLKGSLRCPDTEPTAFKMALPHVTQPKDPAFIFYCVIVSLTFVFAAALVNIVSLLTFDLSLLILPSVDSLLRSSSDVL